MGCCQTRELKDIPPETEKLSNAYAQEGPWPIAKQQSPTKSYKNLTEDNIKNEIFETDFMRNKDSFTDQEFNQEPEAEINIQPDITYNEINIKNNIKHTREIIENTEDSILDIDAYPFPDENFEKVYREIGELTTDEKWIKVVSDYNLEIFKRTSSVFNKECVVLKANILLSQKVPLKDILDAFHIPQIIQAWDETYLHANMISGNLLDDCLIVSRKDHKNTQRNYLDRYVTRKDTEKIMTIICGENQKDNLDEAGRTIVGVILFKKIETGHIVTFMQQIDSKPIMRMPANTLTTEKFKKATKTLIDMLEKNSN